MSTVAAHNQSKPKGPVRAGSAPPVRGYEKPVLHPSSRTNGRSHTTIHSRLLPPKQPAHTGKKVDVAVVQAKKRRISFPPKSPDLSAIRSCLAQQCSLAMSRTESIMVSAAGDVIVCRCRRSSAPLIPRSSRDLVDPWSKQKLRCCDTELLSSIDGPWSPALQNLTTPQAKSISSARTTSSECSTYEWETKSKKIRNHLLGKHIAESAGTSLGNMMTSKQPQRDVNDDKMTDESLQQHIDLNSTRGSKIDDAEEKYPDSSRSGDDTRKDDDSYSRGNGWENTIGDLILSLPSFDYSHFVDGHNDMVGSAESNPERNVTTPSRRTVRRQKQNAAFPTIAESPEEKKEMDLVDNDPPIPQMHEQFFHGVPVFLSSLSQVRVTKVSAHPLGGHVLIISEEALLFSYGLNNHGQLGIGFKTDIKNHNRGFHTTPTLITPLLENGGKTIDCAAGVDHSLVVVATEGRRLQKLQTKPGVAYSDHGAEYLNAPDSPCDPSVADNPPEDDHDEGEHVDERFHFSETSVKHHQVYGFGRNNFMKLGLVRPSVTGDSKNEHAADEVLPRRVALHCTVWPHEGDQDSSLPSQGIFSIAASAEHSAALIRRATGDIEVSMWGNGSLGALGLPLDSDSQEIRGEIARKPSFKHRNVRSLPATVESLSHRKNTDPTSPFATQIALGPYCSFVVMSNGKCMSCGFSAEGMLGQAFNKTHTMEPEEVFLPNDEESPSSSRIVSVSAGAFHVIAISEDGKAFSWGINSNDRLGIGSVDYSDLTENLPQTKKENLVVIEWVPQNIELSQKSTDMSSVDNIKSDERNGTKKRESQNHRNRIALACAGYDSSMLVTESGQVLSFGKRSGRLGRGELSSNVNRPQPLYGGLHLFHAKTADAMKTASTTRPRRIQRRLSASVVE